MKSGGPPGPYPRHHTKSFFYSILAITFVAFATLWMGGCGMGTTELPATTQPGGPGFLSITTPQLSDSVAGLPYTATINTTGGSNTLAACTIISGSLPPGFSPPQPQGSECILTTKGQPVGASGRFTFTLQAGDTSTPQRTDNHVYTLTARPEFTITSPAILDGIAGRSYTRTFTVTTNLVNHAGGQVVAGSSEAGNGPATACAISGLPAAVAGTCTIDASQVNTKITMGAAAGTLAAGAYPFSISVTDSPIAASNQTVLAVPAGTVTLPLRLVVRPEFTITQATLADGVQGRTYGVSPLAQPVATNLSAAPLSESGEPAEAGNGPVTSCALSATASNPGLSVAPNQNTCMLQSVSPVAVASTYGAQSYSVTVSATDNPIKDPASGAIVVPANTITKTLAWTAQAPLSYSLNFDTSAGQPGQVTDAVENRTYGAPAKTELEATAVGGLSNETGAAIAESGALPAGIACANGAPNPTPVLLCGSGGSPVTGAPGAFSFVVTVSDPGNTATPPGSSSTDLNQHTSHALNVDKPLALAANLGTPLPQAVINKSWGAAPLTPLQYTASGGLGGYVFTTATGEAAPGAGFPAGIACAQGTGASINLFSCSTPTGGVITAGASTTTPYTPTVALNDTANGTTPDGAASGTGTSQTSSLTVNPPLAITAAGAAAPAPPPGVIGRTYGVGSGFQALIYTISGGVPPYTLTAINATGAPSADSVPAPMACGGAPAAPAPPTQMICASSTGLVASAGTYPYTVSVHDAGTASDPVSSVSLSQSVTVNAAMTLTPATTTPPLAVIGRTYGSGSNCGASGTTSCSPIVYNIAGGLGGYSPTPTISGFPGTFTCPLSATGLSGTYSCSTSGAVAGTNPATLSLTASDTANTAVPAGTLTSNNVSLSIAQMLTLTLTSGAPPAAVFGRAYATGSGCSGGTCAPVVYAIANGTGVYPASATLTTTAGPFSCALAGSSYDCASTGITLNPGASPAAESLNVSVADVANASTPSASVSNNSATVTVNPALNITGPSGTLAVAVVGRTYGAGSTCGAAGTAACATIGYTITGGLGGYSSTPTRNLYPATFACPFASVSSLSGTYTCSSASGVTGSGSPAVSITASDTANTSTPTASATSNTATLPISPALSLTPPATVNPAVQNRAYGQGSGCSGGGCVPVPYVISGGTTQYSSTATLNSGAGTFTCSLVSTTYDCSSASITGVAGNYTLNFTASDIADASTPASSVPDSSKSVLVNAPLALTLTSGAPAAAVAGRAYGSGIGCTGGGGACAPITYSIANGLGGYTTSIAVVGNPTTITGLGCTLSSSTYSCSATTLGPSTLSPAVTDTLAVTTSDTANASTPSANISNNTASLTINPAMTMTAISGAPATAVVGRAYGTGTGCTGTGGACAPIKYTVAGGLGNYATTGSLSETPTAVTGFACPLSGTTYSCSAATLGPISLSSTAADTLNMSTTETGNASTPGATSPTDTSLTLTVNPELALNITPSPISNGTAVTGRSYGTAAAPNCASGLACAPLQFTATFGTGTYTFTDGSTLTSKGFSCATGTSTYSCTSTNVTATSAVDLSTVSVKDSANASTPAIPTPLTMAASLPVNAALSIPATPAPVNALLGYQFSSASPFFTLTAQNGLSSVGIALWSVYSPAAPPTTLPCPSNTVSVLNGFSLNTATGSIAGAATTAGPVTFDACAADDPDATTPAGPGASAHPPDYSFTVVNPYAYIIDPGNTTLQVIDTGAGPNGTLPSAVTASITSLTLTSPQGVAVTSDGLEAVAIVSTNKLEIINTTGTGNTVVTGSPFSLASGTCTTAKGIAIYHTTGYLLCDNGASASDVFVLPLALSGLSGTTITPSSTISLGASTSPVAIAVSKDGSTVVVAENTATPGLQVITTASGGSLSGSAISLSTGTVPVAVTTAANGANLYAFVAETKASAPGQVDVINVTTKTAVTGSPIAFSVVGTTNPAPSCIAATPDGARIYVGLQQTDQFGVIDNTVPTPALKHQLSLPLSTDSPGGIAIPPLNPLNATGYRVYIPVTDTGSGGSGGVVILNDNAGATPTLNSSFVINTTSTPEGIAAVPVPQ